MRAGAWPVLQKLTNALPAVRTPPLPPGELRMVGVKQPEKIAQISVRNDAAFLITVVGTTSVAAVLLGQLPGDWGFFSAYLCGENTHR